jgi:hypothetical protein
MENEKHDSMLLASNFSAPTSHFSLAAEDQNVVNSSPFSKFALLSRTSTSFRSSGLKLKKKIKGKK